MNKKPQSLTQKQAIRLLNSRSWLIRVLKSLSKAKFPKVKANMTSALAEVEQHNGNMIKQYVNSSQASEQQKK